MMSMNSVVSSNSSSSNPMGGGATSPTGAASTPSTASYQIGNTFKALFPGVLHKILDDAEQQGFHQLVSWNPDGLSFKIHERERFIDEVLPKYSVNQSRYKSFVRQLNIWDFKCIHGGKKNPLRGSYTNDHFVRGRPELCRYMTRTKIKGKPRKGKTAPNNAANKNDNLGPLVVSTTWENTIASPGVNKHAAAAYGQSPPQQQALWSTDPQAAALAASDFSSQTINMNCPKPPQQQLGQFNIADKAWQLQESAQAYAARNAAPTLAANYAAAAASAPADVHFPHKNFFNQSPDLSSALQGYDLNRLFGASPRNDGNANVSSQSNAYSALSNNNNNHQHQQHHQARPAPAIENMVTQLTEPLFIHAQALLDMNGDGTTPHGASSPAADVRHHRPAQAPAAAPRQGSGGDSNRSPVHMGYHDPHSQNHTHNNAAFPPSHTSLVEDPMDPIPVTML